MGALEDQPAGEPQPKAVCSLLTCLIPIGPCTVIIQTCTRAAATLSVPRDIASVLKAGCCRLLGALRA